MSLFWFSAHGPIKFKESLSKPYAWSFDINKSDIMLSKAFDKSVKKAP